MANLEGGPPTPAEVVGAAVIRPETVVTPGRRVPTTTEMAALVAFTRAPQTDAEAALSRQLIRGQIDAALGPIGSIPHRAVNPE